MPGNSQCPFPGIMSIELAVFKATTATKELRWWWLCPFPRRVSYRLLRSQDGHQRLLKMPSRLLKMPWVAGDAISWNSIYYATD